MSKNLADGIRFLWKVERPVRFDGSLGMNHAAQIGTTLLSVEIFVGEFLVRASSSSAGDTT